MKKVEMINVNKEGIDFYLSWIGNDWKEFLEGMEKTHTTYNYWFEQDEYGDYCPTAEIHTEYDYKLYIEFGADGALELVEAMDF